MSGNSVVAVRGLLREADGSFTSIALFELKEAPAGKDVELRFGPTEPATAKAQWIKTIPGKGWFVYFRIHGPEAPAFDGSWKPGDFEREK